MATAIVSCEKSGDFTPVPEKSMFDIALLDTFRVATSTLLIDSIYTSDISRLLVGSIQDPELGTLSTSAYFKFGPSGFLTFEDRNMVYDSLYLTLHYDGYEFGDQAQQQQFTVREIMEEYAVSSEDLYYDFDRLDYGRASLATFGFDPDWESGDSIAIKMSDELGERLFQMAEAGEVNVGNIDFEREFEGLALVPELNSTGQVVGFANSINPTGLNQETYVSLRMYYHEKGEFTDNYYFDFQQTLPRQAFNAIETDRRQSLLANLDGDNPVPAANADHKTFIQAASGIQTKIRFPTVDDLNKLGLEYIVNTAVLRLEPVPGSYGDLSELPDSLALYLTDKYNEVGNVTFSISGSTDIAQYAHLEADDERGLFAYYQFDVTEFIFLQLQDRNRNELALLAAPTAESILGGVDQMQLGGQEYPTPGVKLEIYLTKIID